MSAINVAGTIARIIELLHQNYIFAETAEQMAAHLQAQADAGRYESITNPPDFAEALTADLQSISHDLHLRVNYDPGEAARLASTENDATDDDTGWLHQWLRQMQTENYGFRKVERLTGNIGYLDLRLFIPAQIAGETAVAAMQFLAHCKAVIIDLRQNGGGSPGMIQLLTSYFYKPEDEPHHLNSFYERRRDLHTQFWTLPYIPGKRLSEADVYILTSGYTFSAAEEFTYNLKQLKRATIIGEQTRGGAHPVEGFGIDENLIITVPVGRAINPLTESNWEGMGVEPDIRVPADDALYVAHQRAIEQLLEKSSDPEETRLLKWDSELIRANYEPVQVSQEKLRKYVGDYGDIHSILLQDGALHYHISRLRRSYALLPLSGDRFIGEDYQVRFEDGKLILTTRRDGQERTLQQQT